MSKPRIYCLTIIGLILLVILYLASLWNYLSGEVRQNNRIGTLYESIQQRPDGTVSKALVTLFTTFDDDPDGVNIRINVLHNWSRMRPEAKLILFVWHDGIPPNLASTARSLGWTVKLLRRVSHSGKAFVKDLYRAAMEQHDTPFYGFVSGDILFDGGLLTTLRLVRAELPFLGSTMVIGRRHNAFVGDDTRVSSFSDVARLAKDHGLLYRVDVLDYFVTSRGYPWPHFADVTVGRPAFDSYIAGLAVINGMKVVDATATVTALHQCRAPSKNGGEVPVYSGNETDYIISCHGNAFPGVINYCKLANVDDRITSSRDGAVS